MEHCVRILCYNFLLCILLLCLASLSHQQQQLEHPHHHHHVLSGPSTQPSSLLSLDAGCCEVDELLLSGNLKNHHLPGYYLDNHGAGQQHLEAEFVIAKSSDSSELVILSAQSQLVSELPLTTTLPAVLGDLRISGADLHPSFNVTVFNYSAAMAECASFIKITPVLPPGVQGLYEIKLNTLALKDGEESSPLALGGKFGERMEFSIVVSVAGRLSSTYVLSVIHGKKSSTLWRVVKWPLIVLGAILGLAVILFCLYIIYACIKGSRALGESGHTLGWWPFGYFARGQQSAFAAPDPSRLLAGPSTAQP